MTTLADLPERFWRKVDQTSSDTGCWLWTGRRTKDGYGVFDINRKGFLVHRIVASATGQFIKDRVVMHKCDNPRCCNPDHLLAGSQQENVQDMFNKGRRSNAGINNPRCSITESQARDIKFNYPNTSHAALASQLGLGIDIVYGIRRGVTWRHLK